jgi:glycosyltransferase involved in cell wall biosynthesis
MKILHVVDRISQTTAGGSAKVPFQLSEAQARQGHEVTIYTSDFMAKDQVSPKGVKLVKYHNLINLFGGVRVTPGMLSADYSFDIIHLHNYRTLVNLMTIAKARTCKIILQPHGNCQPQLSKIKPLHDAIWGTIIKRANKIIADAPKEISLLIAEGASLDKITFIPVGLDFNEFKDLPERKPKPYKSILYLGRLDLIKGVDLLLQAFALLHNKSIRLSISGIDYGYEKAMLESIKTIGLQDRIDLVGPLYGRAKLEAYVNADVFMMPSRYEMWGITFMEALACGTPIIMTDRCGSASELSPSCGVVVPFDKVSLAGAIHDVLFYPPGSREYRMNWVRRYDWDILSLRICDLYREALKL